MAEYNRTLLGVNVDDVNAAENTAFEIVTEGQKFGGGASALVPDGNYEMEILSARLEKQKEGLKVGVNLAAQIVAPPGEWVGKRIMLHPTLPMGNPGTDEFDKPNKMWASLLCSIASRSGKAEEMRAAKKMAINCTGLKGAHFYARTKTEEYKGIARSSVAFYLDLDGYNEAPGPDASATFTRPTQAATGNGSGARTNLLGGTQPQPAAPAQAAPAAADPLSAFLK